MENNIQTRVGQQIKVLRLKKKLSQAGLAKLAGTHRTHIQDIEGGRKNWTIATLVAISQALDKKLDIKFTKGERTEEKVALHTNQANAANPSEANTPLVQSSASNY